MLDNKPIRVLIIEDDVDDAGIIGSYLSDAAGAFALTQAPRLSTASHLLARQEFDVVVIDLVLPQSVGLEGFMKIRALKPALPIIILTGLQDEPLAIQAVKLGAQDYLIKGSPDCCMLKRSIRYAIEKKRLSTIIEELLRDDRPAGADGASKAGAPKTPGHLVELRNAAVSDQLKRFQEEIRDGLRALEVKNHFMGEISHELRNTLATMKTAAYCLKDTPAGSLTTSQARMVEIISQNVDRQTRILDNVLDLTRLRPGRLHMQFRPTDVAELISEVVENFGPLAAAKDLRADIDRGLPLVKGDPDLIAQVLRNLIGNALRFAKHKVAINASKAGPKGVSISIIDDGAGIAPERLADFFAGFTLASRPAAGNEHRGSGLGLTICKEIIAGHHGKIWAENAPGQGARLSLLLPVYDKPEKAAPKKGGRLQLGNNRNTMEIL